MLKGVEIKGVISEVYCRLAVYSITLYIVRLVSVFKTQEQRHKQIECPMANLVQRENSYNLNTKISTD